MKDCYDEAFLATALASRLHQKLSTEELKNLCAFLRLLLNNIDYYLCRKK